MENYFNYEMKDGTYMHLEFADHSITEEDLRKYREFEESLEEFYGAPVQTMVICSADVKSIKTELRDGNSIYQIRTISMGEQDGDQILRELEKRKKKGKKIGEKRLTSLVMTPLMAGETSKEQRFCRVLDLIHSEEVEIKEETRLRMESTIYVLAKKLLDQDAFERVKEKIDLAFLEEKLNVSQG
ncbi:hypothetical protein QUW49_13235 [Lacrimispora saccharolytica]|nr:hypothetical protein [Lacrimispora saccharolytica]